MLVRDILDKYYPEGWNGNMLEELENLIDRARLDAREDELTMLPLIEYPDLVPYRVERFRQLFNEKDRIEALETKIKENK